MEIKIEEEDLELAVTGVFQGKYKKYKSNKTLQTNLNKVIQTIRSASSYEVLCRVKSLNCEALQGDLSGLHSIRLGFKEKHRLICRLEYDAITILLLEISEHYGDH